MSMKEALLELSNKGRDLLPLICEVLAVDKAENTCYCRPINGDADVLDARLSVDSDEEKRAVLFPVVGSVIVVIFTKNETPFVVGKSEIEEFDLNAESTNLNLTKDGLSLTNNGQDYTEISTALLDEFLGVLGTLKEFQLATNMGPTVAVMPQILTKIVAHETKLKTIKSNMQKVLK